MEKFTSSPMCPKCKSKDISMEHEPGGDYKLFFGNKTTTVEEHLDCTCDNCGYEWNMETADVI